MRRWVGQAIRIGLALAGLALVLAWMAGTFAAKIEPGEVAVGFTEVGPDRTLITLEPSEVAVVEEAAGTVQAERKTVVSSRILAAIAAVLVRAGDAVEEGQDVIVLDDRELRSRADEAARAVQAAAATRARAASDLERARQLLARGVISQSELEQIETAFKVADAERQRAEAAASAADVGVSYSRIVSPVTGRVVDRFAEPGDTAVPGQPLLSIYDPTALRIEVPVRESLVARLHVGDALAVRAGGGEDTLRGVIDEIVPQAEAGSRTFLVKVGLPRHAGLYTGMFGRVLIPAGTRQRLLVPAAAIRQVGQLTFAEAVVGGRVERRLVTLGPPAGDGRIEVLSGLAAGETVAVGEVGGTEGPANASAMPEG